MSTWHTSLQSTKEEKKHVVVNNIERGETVVCINKHSGSFSLVSHQDKEFNSNGSLLEARRRLSVVVVVVNITGGYVVT